MQKIILAVFCISVLVLGSFGLNNHAQANPQVIPDNYIVIFKDNVYDSQGKANEMANNYGLSVNHVYSHAINGFSAVIPQQALQKILNDPNVSFVEPDQVISIDNNSGNSKGNGGKQNGGSTQPSQVVPTGISRINGPANDMSNSDISVAVIDTGIDATHPDLNVVGGKRCVTGPGGYKDDNGHGTHVSGTIGAKNDSIGVVGVAPGVKLYAVKVLDRNGSGSTSSVICGIDWVIANAANAKIKVANMSLGGGVSTSLDDAVKNAINNGITMVVAAGNSHTDVSNTSPARVTEAITVSALADFDGAPGGIGSPTCRTDVDDTFADFSNYGSGVDIIAPGVCILSTWKGSSYNTISGTSMATPHVTGAAAVYIASHITASPAEVSSALKSSGIYNYSFPSQDLDGIQEPLLDLTSIK